MVMTVGVLQVESGRPPVKGDQPLSARYDPQQCEAERQGFENLMLLCPKHHKLER